MPSFLLARLATWWPGEVTPVGRRQLAARALGAALALWASEALSRWGLGTSAPWFIAPMGASAVLLFAVPASPLAQPWPLLCGNLLSALIGVAVAHVLGSDGLACGLAVGLAIAAMGVTRSLHPPGGAVALGCVIGGTAVHRLGFGYVLAPVGVNVLSMLAGAWLFGRLAGNHYPHRQAGPAPHRTRDPLPRERALQLDRDLHQILEAYGDELDVSEADLRQLFVRLEARVQERALADIRCADIMARDVVTVRPEASLAQVWRTFAQHKVRVLPVVGADRRLAGVISLGGLFTGFGPEQAGAAIDWTAPVERFMVRDVQTVGEQDSLPGLIRQLTDEGFHHVPVLDASGRVCGMISQSDVLAAVVARLPS